MPITEKTLDFLVENRFRDSREWYAAHKDQYVAFVLEPLKELVRDLTPTIQKMDSNLVAEPKVDRCISRIYRDTRFSKDKSLYRSNMWCVFGRDKKEYPNFPGIVFEFSPDGFFYGCGYYEAPKTAMDAIRNLILKNDPAFVKAKRAYDKQTLFQMEGALYKRKKFPDAPDALSPWLERKNYAFMHREQNLDLLFSDQLSETLAAGFLQVKPMYDFLCKGAALAK